MTTSDNADFDAFPAVRAWRDGGEFVALDGHRVFCRHEGAGPRLLLIHGFPTSSFDWRPMWADLTAHFEVLSLDLLGFGLSAKPHPHAYRVRAQADLIEALARHHGWRDCAVLAHDYGDSVAQELLARYLERAEPALQLHRMCFLNGGLFPETHRSRPIQRLLASPLGPWLTPMLNFRSFARSFSPLFSPGHAPSEIELREHWALIEHGGGKRVAPALLGYMAERRRERERWVDALCADAPSRPPLRLICGALDPVSGAHLAARYRELVPQADVVLLDDLGHYPQLEDPVRVFAAACEFLLGD